jgi:hypothetical protein
MPALDSRTPASFLDTSEGLGLVLSFLAKIQSAAYS